MGPERLRGAALVSRSDGPSSHRFLAPDPGGWTQMALMEWELRQESWTDCHPHDEFNYVLEGQLFVSAAGQIVEAVKGDLVRVPAGSVGRYWAPGYAGMFAMYGPNPAGRRASAWGSSVSTPPRISDADTCRAAQPR